MPGVAVPGVVVPADAVLQSTLSNAVEVTARATIQDDAPQPLSPRALTQEAAECALLRSHLRASIEMTRYGKADDIFTNVQRMS